VAEHRRRGGGGRHQHFHFLTQTGRYSYCIGENEKRAPGAAALEHGFAGKRARWRAIAAEAPQSWRHDGATAREILATIARSGIVIASETHAGLGDTVL